MKKLGKRYYNFLAAKETGTSLALLRIAIGCCLLGCMLTLAYADIVDVFFIDAKFGGAQNLSAKFGPWPIRWLGGPTPTVMWSVWWITVISAVLIIVGVGGRWPCLPAVLGFFSFYAINNSAGGSSDLMVANALWLLFLSQPTATLSVDCWLRNKKWTSTAEVFAWPRYLFILQVVVVYALTGMQKLHPVWTPSGGYSALYYILQDPLWARYDWTPLVKNLYPVTQLATATAWFFEATAPLMFLVLHYRRTPDKGGRMRRWFNRFDLRKPWVLIGLGLHAGIFLTMCVGVFSFIITSYYIALWNSAEHERHIAWAQQRWAQMRGRTTPTTAPAESPSEPASES